MLPFTKRIPRVVVDVAERREVARVRERVVHGDCVVGGGEHVPHVVRADEAGAAGDEDASRSRAHRPVGPARRPGGRRASGSAGRGRRASGSVTPQSAAIAGSSHATPSSSAGL